MNVLAFLIPISLCLGGGALIAFVWGLHSGQYEDPKGNSERILLDETGPPLE